MLINAQAVKNARVARNWTQQQLADACALSIRTIQRVERYGNTSQETSMALHAVFELPAESLLLKEDPIREDAEQSPAINKAREVKLMIAALIVGLALGLLMASLVK